jgi:hypothetical protein
VNAKGSSDVPVWYTYRHNTEGISAPVLYYRLQMVDKDGKQSYSVIRKTGASASGGFSIIPNPAGRYVSITGEGLVQLRVSRLNGQAILSREVLLPLTSFDTRVMTAGIYIITITAQDGTMYSGRLVVR